MGLLEGVEIGKVRRAPKVPTRRTGTPGTAASGAREPRITSKPPVPVVRKTVPPKPATTGGRGATGGGTTGGGGTGGGTTGSTGTTTTTATETEEDTTIDDLEAKRIEALKAALVAIGADFGLQDAELGAQYRNFMNEFSMGMQNSRYQQGLAQEGVQNNMLERGIFRSGINLSDTARAIQPHVATRADLVGRFNPVQGQLGTELVAIEDKRNLLEDAKAAAEASTTVASEREALDLELMRKLAAAGLG